MAEDSAGRATGGGGGRAVVGQVDAAAAGGEVLVRAARDGVVEQVVFDIVVAGAGGRLGGEDGAAPIILLGEGVPGVAAADIHEHGERGRRRIDIPVSFELHPHFFSNA